MNMESLFDCINKTELSNALFLSLKVKLQRTSVHTQIRDITRPNSKKAIKKTKNDGVCHIFNLETACKLQFIFSVFRMKQESRKQRMMTPHGRLLFSWPLVACLITRQDVKEMRDYSASILSTSLWHDQIAVAVTKFHRLSLSLSMLFTSLSPSLLEIYASIYTTNPGMSM